MCVSYRLVWPVSCCFFFFFFFSSRRRHTRLQGDWSSDVCSSDLRQLERALTLAPLATYQAPYSLFDRDVEERDLPLCRARGLAFLAYRPLAAGLLTGKYEAPPQFADGDHRQRIYWFKGKEFERRRRVIERLRPIAQREGRSLIGLALGWLCAIGRSR